MSSEACTKIKKIRNQFQERPATSKWDTSVISKLQELNTGE